MVFSHYMLVARRRESERRTPSSTSSTGRMLPFFVEFVKFSTVFAVVIALGLFTLHIASASIEPVAF